MSFSSLIVPFIPSAFVYALLLALLGLIVSRFTFDGPRKGMFTTFLVTGLIIFYISLYFTIKLYKIKF